jgi:hypothetical protein
MFIYTLQMNAVFKLCRDCYESKGREQFYNYSSYCKPCHNKKRLKYVRHAPAKGMKLLTGDTLSNILRDINAGFNLKETAIRNNITYTTIRKFNKRRFNPLL